MFVEALVNATAQEEAEAGYEVVAMNAAPLGQAIPNRHLKISM